jgi:hypothetical protein
MVRTNSIISWWSGWHVKCVTDSIDGRNRASEEARAFGGRKLMKVLGKTLALGVLGSLFAFPVMAQESAPPQEPAPNAAPMAVQNGNTTIEFQSAASNPDVNRQQLAVWGDFADAHPHVAHALAYKPSLINDPAYLGKHPELADFFASHPEIKEAMAENPGNFVAIPPRPGE